MENSACDPYGISIGFQTKFLNLRKEQRLAFSKAANLEPSFIECEESTFYPKFSPQNCSSSKCQQQRTAHRSKQIQKYQKLELCS
ncbi:hypothetical protein AVEN_60164-1, partial [Araneus ventricosus]